MFGVPQPHVLIAEECSSTRPLDAGQSNDPNSPVGDLVESSPAGKLTPGETCSGSRMLLSVRVDQAKRLSQVRELV